MTFGTITISTVSVILVITAIIMAVGGLVTIAFSFDSSSSAGLVGLMLIIIATFMLTFNPYGNEITKQNNKNIESAIKDNFKDAKILNNDKECWTKGYFVSQEKTYTFEITDHDILLIKYDNTDVMRISGNDY